MTGCGPYPAQPVYLSCIRVGLWRLDRRDRLRSVRPAQPVYPSCIRVGLWRLDRRDQLPYVSPRSRCREL